jgi:hypothetical protein
MANIELLAFNRGLVSRLALARTDIKRVSMSAEEQVNWIPRVLGPMSLRPGLQYLGNTNGNLYSSHIPFIFSTTDTALIELTNNVMRIRVNEALVTRASVSTAVTNGTFTSNVTSWTDSDEVGGTSAWATGGYMSLLGNGTAAAIRDQTLTVAVGDQNVEHALNIVVTQGECILRVGSSAAGTDELISETTLRPGQHSLAFTPTSGSVYVRLMSRLSYATLVDSCVIASAGVMTITSPWASTDLLNIRAKQSGDVLFVACTGVAQKRIERRATNSWSIVDYVANLGPFRVGNSTPITLAPSALSGTITLTASQALFKSTNVGSLFSIDSTGQAVSTSITASDVYSDPIRVTGIAAGRTFGITVTGTWVGTVTLQRSVGDIGSWVDVSSYTTNQSTTLSDTLDNQIIYYRIGVKPTNYTSGTIDVSLAYAAGTIKGIARVTAYTSTTSVTAVVVKAFGALTATVDWAEGSWSPRRGYPSAVGLHEGRVWWAGKDKILGSVSDDFANFDDSTVGDSGPINRSIGAGPVDTINWLLESQQLLVGAQGAELICRSSSLGEPLTPTNFNLKEATSRGSRGVEAVKVDTSAIFVDRSGSRVYELEYDNIGVSYSAVDLTAIAPEVGEPTITHIAVQRRPDTRIHFVRSDGKVAILVFDKAEDVKAWITVETDGLVEDVFVLPGDEEDKVYYTVARTIGGSTVRFLERWAKQSECVGETLNKQADAYVSYTGAATTTITGLSHLEGKSVVCWADGVDKGTYTVASGQITLLTAVTNAVVGLTYRARYKSVKLSMLTKAGAVGPTLKKKVNKVGLMLLDTHAQGLMYGQEYDYLDDLPQVEQGAVVDPDYIWADYDFDAVEINGTHDNNARLCLEANAPRPCTVLAAALTVTMNEK